jgi:hypothetical protein
MEQSGAHGSHFVALADATRFVPADTIRYPDQPQVCGFFL